MARIRARERHPCLARKGKGKGGGETRREEEEEEEEEAEDAGRERCGMKSGRKEGEEEECKDKKILKYKDLKAIFENKERLGGGAGGAGGEGGSGTVRLWLNGKWNSHEVCMHMCVIVCLCACI